MILESSLCQKTGSLYAVCRCHNHISYYVHFRRFESVVSVCTRDVCLFIFYVIIPKWRHPTYCKRRPAWPCPCTGSDSDAIARGANIASDQISCLVSSRDPIGFQWDLDGFYVVPTTRLTGRPILTTRAVSSQTWLYSRMCSPWRHRKRAFRHRTSRHPLLRALTTQLAFDVMQPSSSALSQKRGLTFASSPS